jgi:hypothetical protein
MSTRTLARPVVLMVVHGLVRAHTRRHGVQAAPDARQSWQERWPVHESFVPQKVKATRRLKQLALVGVVALTVAVAVIASMLL